MKLSSLLSSVVLAFLLVGCGGIDEGACCKSNIKHKDISNKVEDSNIESVSHLNDDIKENKPEEVGDSTEHGTNLLPVDKPTNQDFVDLPPIAVIDVSNCDSSYTISCKDSYDADEDGTSIEQCNWDIVSYDIDGCVHESYQRYDTNDTQDVFIEPCEHVKYIEVKLTVIDNEGSHDCVTQKVEVR